MQADLQILQVHARRVVGPCFVAFRVFEPRSVLQTHTLSVSYRKFNLFSNHSPAEDVISVILSDHWKVGSCSFLIKSPWGNLINTVVLIRFTLFVNLTLMDTSLYFYLVNYNFCCCK